MIDADHTLELAIRKCCDAYGLLKDPECGEPQMMGDYIAVVEAMKFDGEGDLSDDFYALIMPNGNLPTARAIGLLDYGMHMLKHGRRVDDEV